jgi:hypothetical protein
MRSSIRHTRASGSIVRFFSQNYGPTGNMCQEEA